MPGKKSKDEIDAEREKAQQQLNEILSASRPKNLTEGIGSGISNIVQGAVGAAGIAVIAPTIGLAAGLQRGGIIGGALGAAGGGVIGALGAAALAIGGVTSGVMQIGRGIIAVPEAITAPRDGKWWDEVTHEWILTNLDEEAALLVGVPEDDHDILGKTEAEIDEGISASFQSGDKKPVVDMFYYEALEVPSDAEPSAIKRQYYLLARKYHPDKVGHEDKEAAEKFKVIAEAYQVLSDAELRKKYDQDGRGGLSADKTSVVDGMPKLDPALLFAFLFGSDQFNDYIGRMSTATSAMVGDSNKISSQDARKVQQRRVARLAFKLVDRITPWVNMAKTGVKSPLLEREWSDAALALTHTSFGYQLVTTIGKIYNLLGIVYEGSSESGQGLPTIAKWALKNQASAERHNDATKHKMEALRANFDMMKLQMEAKQKLEKATSDAEKDAIKEEMEESTVAILMRILWTTFVVDITATLYETTQMVFFDQSVDKETRKFRAEAVKLLGELWTRTPEPEVPETEAAKNAKELYEEAAFAAMLETVRRKDEAAHAAT